MARIITFHGSHNLGSMLQAYATQQVLSKLGYESEIINFRMKSQKEFLVIPLSQLELSLKILKVRF